MSPETVPPVVSNRCRERGGGSTGDSAADCFKADAELPVGIIGRQLPPMPTRRGLAGTFLAVALTTSPVLTQSDVDVAIKFFASGGAYCFRVAPEGVALLEEAEWTVMVLAGSQNGSETFRIRSIDAGRSRMTAGELSAGRTAVTNVWRLERRRANFFDRFASGIEAGTLRARVVKVAPTGLAQMSPSARADAYLKFTDRGARVSFKNAPDLTASAFRQYATHFAD